MSKNARKTDLFLRKPQFPKFREKIDTLTALRNENH